MYHLLLRLGGWNTSLYNAVLRTYLLTAAQTKSQAIALFEKQLSFGLTNDETFRIMMEISAAAGDKMLGVAVEERRPQTVIGSKLSSSNPKKSL